MMWVSVTIQHNARCLAQISEHTNNPHETVATALEMAAYALRAGVEIIVPFTPFDVRIDLR